MAQEAPGKHCRKGISLVELMAMFPTERKAEKWLRKVYWKGTPHCPRCGSLKVNMKARHPTMPHYCAGCNKYFSVKTNSCMEGSKVSCRKWAIATYLFVTNPKGISSMRLHRELGVTQKTAWFILHRLREAHNNDPILFEGPVQVDETYFGPKTAGMNTKARARRDEENTGRGPVGKLAVAGIKDTNTKQAQFAVLPDTKGKTIRKFVIDRTVPGAEVHTDEAKAYKGLDRQNRIHKTVNHSEGEYVRKAHDGRKISTNEMESGFGSLKAITRAVYHKISPGHLPSYLNEKAGRDNLRELDTVEELAAQLPAMRGKRLRYVDLVAGTAEIVDTEIEERDLERKELDLERAFPAGVRHGR